uniref:Succinate:cytochrome c oxidoreductase subunit 4 n=1 Tax=Montagnia macrospora TaxID=2662032 RepID=A0A343UXT6_9FLOR|nr:succinate:cytochrome c oxidoreductase subunit 4 [Montagnia macrospora]AVK39493.1 succinate:cytochrome c oxidoreductase subunit 4 [Montagnia macrospora]
MFPFFVVSTTLIFSAFTFDFEFFYLTSSLILFHILKGLSAVVKDYIYFKALSIFYLFCVRISVLGVLRYLIDFLL